MPLCPKCGTEYTEGVTKCAGCGNALPEAVEKSNDEPMQKPIKRNAAALLFGALSVILAVALVLSLTVNSGASVEAVASESFSTPEDAIKYFVERLAAGDYEGALSACSINEIAKGYNYKAGVEQRQFIEPIRGESYLPSEYELYVTSNANRLEERILKQMACFTVSFNLPEEFNFLVLGIDSRKLKNGQTPDDLIKLLDPAKISGLVLVDIGKLKGHDSELFGEMRKKWAEIFGADDIQSREVLYQYNGKFYVGGISVIEYGGRWLIQNMSDSPEGIGIPSLGTPVPVADRSVYEDLLEQE